MPANEERTGIKDRLDDVAYHAGIRAPALAAAICVDDLHATSASFLQRMLTARETSRS